MNTLWLYRTVGLLAGLLPRGAGYAIARRAAGWACRHQHAAREALTANLRIVLDARGRPASNLELQQLVRRNFDNFGKYVIDFFQIGRVSPEAFAALLQVEHIDYLRQCRALKRGIVGLTAHVGNWELGAVVVGMQGCRVNAIVRQQPTAKLDALFQARRRGRGVRVLPMDGAAKSVRACLKRDEFVAMLADIDFTRREPAAPFFGKPARLPRGPAVLAARAGAPILPAFVLRQADDTFRFRAYPPILPDRSRSIEATQARIVEVLEAVIGEHPDQWFAYEPLWAPRAGAG